MVMAAMGRRRESELARRVGSGRVDHRPGAAGNTPGTGWTTVAVNAGRHFRVRLSSRCDTSGPLARDFFPTVARKRNNWPSRTYKAQRLDGLPPHLHPLALDLTTDPLPAERYELIYTLMTLHHVPDTTRLLRDFYTLLRPGGWLGIADLDQEDGSFHGAGFTGHCGFDREALRAQLFSVGFNHVDFSTSYLMKKATDQGLREYSLFLAVATRL